MQSLRKHLLEELEEAFPDEVDAYREIRASSAAVSLVVLINMHDFHLKHGVLA